MVANSLTGSLPPQLIYKLRQLAHKYHQDGLDLFVFGSFARGEHKSTSDLDLGVEWRGKRKPEVFLKLYWDIQALPTIRKIELVDFDQADPNFRQIAASDKIYL